jgi:hypothetical protein
MGLTAGGKRLHHTHQDAHTAYSVTEHTPQPPRRPREPATYHAQRNCDGNRAGRECQQALQTVRMGVGAGMTGAPTFGAGQRYSVWLTTTVLTHTTDVSDLTTEVRVTEHHLLELALMLEARRC